MANNPNPVNLNVLVRTEVNSLNANPALYDGIAEIPYKLLPAIPPFGYIIFRQAGVAVPGTTLAYATEDEACAELNALRSVEVCPLYIRINGVSSLVFTRKVCSSISNWIQLFQSVWASRTTRFRSNINEVERVGNVVLAVFRSIAGVLRQQFLSGGNTFDNLQDSFVVNEDSTVVIVKGPRSPGGDFGDNIRQLREICQILIDLLDTMFSNQIYAKAYQRLVRFKGFMDDEYDEWKNYGQDQGMSQFMALHHPAVWKEEKLLMLFTNLGRLGRQGFGPKSDILCLNPEFGARIAVIKNWTSYIQRDASLKITFFNHILDAKNNSYGYYVDELPVFCDNAIKHYWQQGGKDLTKPEVIGVLRRHVFGIDHHLFVSYTQAVVAGRYKHSRHSPHDVFAGYI